jgi:hypothetical protein
MGLIYRIENAEGTGPYQGMSDDESPLPMQFSETHPSPEDDSLLVRAFRDYARINELDTDGTRTIWGMIYGDFLFGFGSQDQLRRWVYNDEWMVKLDNAGFHLSVYEIPDEKMIVGHTQAVFERSAGRQKYRCKLCDFFAIPTE